MYFLSASNLERETREGTVILNNNVPTLLRVVLTAFFSVWTAWMVFGVGGIGTESAMGWFQGWIALMVTPIVLVLYGIWSWTNRLTLKLYNGSYQWEKGFYPFIRTRNGALNEFRQIECVQRKYDGQGGSYVYWAVSLHWKEGKRTPPSCYLDNSSGTESAVRELAERLGVPLVWTPLVPGVKNGEKVAGYIFLGIFGLVFLLIVGSGIYNVYEGRGPRFPTLSGQKQTINLKLGDFRARTLEARLTGSRIATGQGEHGGYTYTLKNYTVALDIENTGSLPGNLDFEVGFSGATRQTVNTGLMQPGEHRTVTANFETSGDTRSLFIRAAQ